MFTSKKLFHTCTSFEWFGFLSKRRVYRFHVGILGKVNILLNSRRIVNRVTMIPHWRRKRSFLRAFKIRKINWKIGRKSVSISSFFRVWKTRIIRRKKYISFALFPLFLLSIPLRIRGGVLALSSPSSIKGVIAGGIETLFTGIPYCRKSMLQPREWERVGGGEVETPDSKTESKTGSEFENIKEASVEAPCSSQLGQFWA